MPNNTLPTSCFRRSWLLRAMLCPLVLLIITLPATADPIRAPGVDRPVDPLIPLVDQAIAVTRQRNLDFQVHTPWQILHGLLALRNNYTLKNGDQFVNALDHITTSATFKGERWFQRTPHGGRAHPYNGTPYDFEGHVNQTLAILAMCDLPLSHQFVLADGSTVTMADMVRHAQLTVSTREETTWTLWLLTHYLDQDSAWTNADGERWSMETLVRIQTASSTHNAPCGGCHSLFALAYARNAYLQKHGKLQGSWLEADQKLQQYIAASQSMQNRDGSFSTQFYKARGFSYDFNERIKTSGHILEWLMVALPRKRLDEHWVRLGIQTLANDLIRNASQPADCGPLYHSLHALILYKKRVQPERTQPAPEQLATRPSQQAGPVTVYEPDGESMPLSTTQQQELAAQAAPILNKDNATPEKFQNPIEARPQQPQSAVNSQRQLPTLITPPITITPAKPVQVVEDPGSLKKLAAEVDEETEKAQRADAESIDAAALSPVPDGMPILKRSAARQPESTVKAEAEDEEAAESTTEQIETTTEPKTLSAPADAEEAKSVDMDKAVEMEEQVEKAKASVEAIAAPAE